MRTLETRILDEPAHHELPIPHLTEEELETHGYQRHVGAPKGQAADYRKPLPDGRGFHVRDYGDRMTLHWDHVDPSVSKIGHLVKDTPWLVAGVAVLSAALAGTGVRRWWR